MENRLFLTLEQAIDVLPEKEQIHCFMNGSFGLVGADWDKGKVKETLSNSDSIEIGGEQCKALGHALVCVPKGAKYQSDIYFFESDKEKVEYYEELLGEKSNETNELAEPKQDTKWQKLKEWVEENKYKQLDDRYIEQLVDVVNVKSLLDKMQELEG